MPASVSRARSAVRWRLRTHSARRRGPALQRVPRHGAVLADARGAADGRNHHSVGFGSIGELSTGFPGLLGGLSEGSAPFVRILQENGYSTAAFGKWHLTPDHQQGPAGPFDRWPDRLGLRLLLGLPRRRGRPVRPAHHREPDDDRTAGRTTRTSTCPTPWPTRRSSGCTASGPRSPTSRGSPTTRPAARTPRTTSRRSGASATRAGSTTAGTPTARRRSSARSGSASSRPTPS